MIYHHKNNRLKLFILLLLIFHNQWAYAVLNDFDRPVDHPPIPLFDEQGNHVALTKNPYSPKKSCQGSGCHDYEAITHAYHFEMGRDETKDDYGQIRNLPQLVSPGYFGGYSCMGGSNPQVLAKKNNVSEAEFADYGAAGYVKTCMTCHAGGGWAEKDRNGVRYDEKNLATVSPLDGDYFDWVKDPQTGNQHLQAWDWKKSGVGEADCLFCHVKFSSLKRPPESGLSKALSPRHARTALVEKGFFRQAASGIMEYVSNTEGVNLLTIARTEGDFQLNDQGLPIFNWNLEAFDQNGRVVLSMLRFPENDNCMECHLTSNSRRGFYGFGEAAAPTLAAAAEGDGETPGAGGSFVDDYRDDIHKGTNFIENNGEKRSIESCNSCHSSLYYKPFQANVDLDADHNFPKGNSDMDVRNDLDYTPNVKSCEYCHLHAINAIVGPQPTLLDSHRELWKSDGLFAGYDEASYTAITQRHFDTVSCQACHIVNKQKGDGADNELQMMYRFRVAEDGLPKISPYNPRLRYYWKDKKSGRVLYKRERDSVMVRGVDESGNVYGDIVNPIDQQILGRVSGRMVGEKIYLEDPDSYEGYVALKTALDNLLITKGYEQPDTTMVWTESNEYVISHNTRPVDEALACRDCHLSTATGGVSQELSDNGLLGVSNIKLVTKLPDARLVSEGVVTLGLPYNKIEPDGRITQNVDDILFETKIDAFMSVLKNSSANEIAGEFRQIPTHVLLDSVGAELKQAMQSEFTDSSSFYFMINKGKFTLRNMASAISGNAINTVLLPTVRVNLAMIEGAEPVAQSVLDTLGFGQLSSPVFRFDMLDASKRPMENFNGSNMFMKVAYKGDKTELAQINVVVADTTVHKVYTVPESDIVMMKPASEIEDGYVIFKMKETGYFLVANK